MFNDILGLQGLLMTLDSSVKLRGLPYLGVNTVLFAINSMLSIESKSSIFRQFIMDFLVTNNFTINTDVPNFRQYATLNV